jgi:hypothetical protein
MPGFKRAALTILTLIQRCMEQMMDDDRGPVEKSISLHFVGLPKQRMFALTEKGLIAKVGRLDHETCSPKLPYQLTKQVTYHGD